MNAFCVYSKQGPLFEVRRLFEPNLVSSILVSSKMSKLFHNREEELQQIKLIKNWKTYHVLSLKSLESTCSLSLINFL